MECYQHHPKKVFKLDIGSGLNYYKGVNNDEIDEWIHLDGDPAPHVEIVCKWDNIPIEDGLVDTVHSSETLEHIPVWEMDKVMKEWNRIMKIGCHFFGTTPSLAYVCKEFTNGNMNYINTVRNLYGDGAGYHHTHYHLFTIDELKYFLTKYGFGEIDFSQSPGDSTAPFWIIFSCIKVKNI